MDLSNRELTILNITQKMSEDIRKNSERLTMTTLESELECIQLSTTVIIRKIALIYSVFYFYINKFFKTIFC